MENQPTTEVTDCETLRSAVAGTAPDDAARKRFLIKKSIDLGCVDDIPDDWEVEIQHG